MMNTKRLCLIVSSAFWVVLAISIGGCDKGKHEATEKGTPSTRHADHPPVDAHDETHEHDDGDDHDHGRTHGGEGVPLLTTYAAAVSQLEHELQEIDGLLDSGKVKETHEACDIIVQICEQMPKLAMDSKSGVSRDAIKSINQVQKDLAALAKKGHAASETENADQLKSLHGEMAELAEALSAYAAQDDSKHNHHHE